MKTYISTYMYIIFALQSTTALISPIATKIWVFQFGKMIEKLGRLLSRQIFIVCLYIYVCVQCSCLVLHSPFPFPPNVKKNYGNGGKSIFVLFCMQIKSQWQNFPWKLASLKSWSFSPYPKNTRKIFAISVHFWLIFSVHFFQLGTFFFPRPVQGHSEGCVSMFYK